MSSLNISIPHELSQDDAVARIKKLLTKLQVEQKDMIQNVKEEWNGNKSNFSFSAKGFDIAGNIAVNPDSVNIKGDLPFMLSFFKGKIEEIIKAQGQAVLKGK